jgi:DNA-binding LacI/PurR family transcriptional regulator
MASKVTIADVAQHAGVSTGTVSAVLNEKPTVRPETRDRVLASIDELGYAPSKSAQELGGAPDSDASRSGTIGVIIKEADNPFYSELIMEVRRALKKNGYDMFVGTSGGDYAEEGELIDSFRDHHVDGLIIAPVLHEDADLSHLFTLNEADFPFVLLEDVQGLQANVVSIDNVKAAQRAVVYLIRQGHERILHFAGPPYTQHTRDRILGVQKAFSESSLRYTDEHIVSAGAHMEDGFLTAIDLFEDMKKSDLPTAVTCFNDLVAMGVLRALAQLYIDVPEDISVVGYDDIQPADYLTVPLTTVRASKREMGEKAARLLLKQINAEDPVEPRHAQVESELAIRASTRPITR